MKLLKRLSQRVFTPQNSKWLSVLSRGKVVQLVIIKSGRRIARHRL